jgi:hypothetical protein
MTAGETFAPPKRRLLGPESGALIAAFPPTEWQQKEERMRIASKIALAAAAVSALALVSVASPALAHGYGWRTHHHHGWHHRHHGYAPAVSDYYHRSRQLVGTR